LGASFLVEAPVLSAGGFTPDVRLADGPPPGWVSLTRLAKPVDRARRLRLIAEAAGPGAPARLPLFWELEAAAWYVGVAVGGAALSDATRPDAGPDATWISVGDDGLAAGIALHAGADPALPGPGAARASITALMEPVVESVGAGISTGVLGWLVGDRVADAVLWCGEALESSESATALAGTVLAPGVPYAVPLRVDGSGGRTRRTCCLARRIPGEQPCEGCPLAHPQRQSSQ
jgi:hypothetical protein